MIEIEQKIHKEDFKKVFRFWYNSFLVPKFDLVIGALLIIMAIMILIVDYKIIDGDLTYIIIYTFCFFFGVYLIFIKRFAAIRNIVNSAMTSRKIKDFVDSKINIDSNGNIRIIEGESKSEITINSLVGYSIYQGYLVMFIARNSFIIVKNNSYKTGSVENLIEILKENNLKFVKNPKRDIK